MLEYMKKIRSRIFLAGFLCVAYNLYFSLFLPAVNMPYLAYLNVLIAVGLFGYGAAGYLYFKKERAGERSRKEETDMLREKVQEQFSQNCELQDYITKWCHEVKIPLSASLLLAEKVEEKKLRESLREQLERINAALRNALLGCKVQSSLFDLQIRRVSLEECVKASVHNNQFFLIHRHFELDLQVGEISVYTDKAWLVYVLDQLLGNAVKYAGERAQIRIWSEIVSHTEEKGVYGIGEGMGRKTVKLFVEDSGVGIREDELRRIFEKGFVGSNYHNGRYKSTGMGLYMAKKILNRLGHDIEVESAWGQYTRFAISFADKRFLQ